MSHSHSQDLLTREELTDLLSQRILVTDGATGTALEQLKPTAQDFGGEEFFGCNEMLNAHGEWVPLAVHKSYLEAGADILETNSFNGSDIVLAEYGIAGRARELARKSAELAHQAIAEWRVESGESRVAGSSGLSTLNSKLSTPKFVLGSMGPGTRTIQVTQNVTFAEIVECYHQYAAGLLEGGADMLVLETQQDTLNVKAALLGVQTAQRELDRAAPLLLSVTIEPNGCMLAGQTIDALYHTIAGFDLFAVGLNCATGPELMTDHLRTLAELSRLPVTVWPNAGLPDHEGRYSEGPDFFRDVMHRFAKEGFINIVGGCCGTTPAHIRAICEAVDGIKPRVPRGGWCSVVSTIVDTTGRQKSESQVASTIVDATTRRETGFYPALAGAETMLVEADNKPVYIGERTNTIGSRKFKRLVASGNWDEASEVGRDQVKRGAMVLDVCCADPDRDELVDFTRLGQSLLRKVRVPLLIDTTDVEVVEAALKMIGGKPAINSVNLEDGGERLRKVAGLARQYGASLICGLIDDDPIQGMAVTVERKLEVAEKTYRILKDEFDFPDTDIIFDPLVFPAGTGDQNYLGSAKLTIEGVNAVKERFPDCLTLLGISNVSFGLPPAGRETVNSVFLYLCTKAGLDMAIVNTEGLRRYPTIPTNEVALATQLLMEGTNEVIAEFTAHFREAKTERTADEWAALPVEEQVSRAVIEARKTGLEKNILMLLERMSPLEVINGPLLAGMDEVGKLFGSNQLIVAEVLESAEVMKAAVDIIRPFFKAGDTSAVKGKLLLATVKGDVHDIGKNLVDMILSNNGYEVVNLGIKVAPETLIEAVKNHRPDMIGLSGLLVRSAQQMVHTADDLRAAGIDLPLLVGGAALSKKFTLLKISPAYNGPVFYAAEAMEGLQLANQIADKEEFSRLKSKWQSMRDTMEVDEGGAGSAVAGLSVTVSRPANWIPTDVPTPPDLTEHILDKIPVDLVWPYINDQMLYGKHLGIKGVTRKLAEGIDSKLLKLKDQVREVVAEAIHDGILSPKAIYRWFAAKSVDETIQIEELNLKSQISNLKSFSFPRQNGREGISAIDWIRPPEQGGDHVAMFVVTAGLETGTRAAEMRKEGRLLASLILQSVAIELAEATAEWVHKRIRQEWGIGDPEGLEVQDVFRTKYRGIRLSFGYPACPSLEDQKPLFELLQPERIGVELTEGFMMHPEGSVSALVFHHPAGKYYAV